MSRCVTRRTVHGRERFVLHMYAKAVQGMQPAEAVKWADGLIAKIHA